MPRLVLTPWRLVVAVGAVLLAVALYGDRPVWVTVGLAACWAGVVLTATRAAWPSKDPDDYR